MENVLQTYHLTKRYGNTAVVIYGDVKIGELAFALRESGAELLRVHEKDEDLETVDGVGAFHRPHPAGKGGRGDLRRMASRPFENHPAPVTDDFAGAARGAYRQTLAPQ